MKQGMNMQIHKDPMEEYKEKYKIYKDMRKSEKSLKGFWIYFYNVLVFFAIAFPFIMLFLCLIPMVIFDLYQLFGFFGLWALLGFIIYIAILLPFKILIIKVFYSISDVGYYGFFIESD